MLKYEHIAPQSKVRAFDFEPMPGRRNRFIEGFVLRHDDNVTGMPGVKFLVVGCYADSAFPEGDNRVGEEIYVPMETSMDYDGRVEVVA